MGSSLFEQNLSGSAFRRGLPLPREIRLTGIILSSSLSLFLSRWVKNGPVNCHDGLTSAEDCEQANKASPASLIFTAATKSSLAVKPHWTHVNFSLRNFTASRTPTAGILRRYRYQLGKFSAIAKDGLETSSVPRKDCQPRNKGRNGCVDADCLQGQRQSFWIKN